MRQGQHPKKNRGRNRRPSNPTNRVYESNGPDVKIRGNASHVSEKYLTLARDAQSSGDPIAAENYLQHAEHYLRIIAATQAQQQSQNQPCAPEHAGRGGGRNGSGRPRNDSRQANGDGRDVKADQAEAVEAPKAEEKPQAADAQPAETAPVEAAPAEAAPAEVAPAEAETAEEKAPKKPARANGRASSKKAAEKASDDSEPSDESVEEAVPQT